MGQNSSTQQGSPSPRRRVTSPSRRKAPPTPAPPPKLPSYVVAENFVLPGGLSDVAGARRLLRPVSQELTKFHPDFADIFSFDSEVDALPRGDTGDVEKPASLTTSIADNPSGLENGSASFVSENAQTQLEQTSETQANHNFESTINKPADNDHNVLNSGHNQSKTNLRRTQSMEARPRPQVGGRNQDKFHKRQLSVTPVIPEDPREHLYNVTRQEPFSNAQPAGASLPLASSFGLDYSFNVTYAQLADFRRKQREEEMGGKLDGLSAEIKASSTVPKSPFDRMNIGEKSATRSVSTGSSETGVSKSKKKKAPAPPPPPNIPPLARQTQRDQSPSRMSLTTEPPADYDMGTDMSPTPSPPSTDRAFHRSFSSAGEYDSKSCAASTRRTERNSGHDTNPQPSNKDECSPPTPPPPPPAPPLPGTPGALKFPPPKPTEEKPSTPRIKNISSSMNIIPGHSELQKSVAETKAQIEELKRLQNILKSGGMKPKETSSPADENTEEKRIETLDNENGLSESLDYSTHPSPCAPETSNKSGKVSTPRLSSLLQHDIVLAAQARGAKVVKTKPPPVLEKPKDLAEIFREELAKAAQAREERRSRDVVGEDFNNNKEDKKHSTEPGSEDPSFIFKSSFLKISKRPPPTMAKPEVKAFPKTIESKGFEDADDKLDSGTQESGEVKIKGTNRIPEIEDRDERDSSLVSKRSSIQSEDMSISSSNNSQRVFAPSWAPEDDLDSDDDMMNDGAPPFTRVFQENRNVPSAGFKSSVFPTKIDSLKNDKSKKDKDSKEKERKGKDEQLSNLRQQVPEEAKKLQVTKPEDGLESGDREEKKLGNLRKLQKGVKNAFGSISKASGKLLKRRKSQDILDIPGDVNVAAQNHSEVSMNPNWSLGDTNGGSLRRVASEGHMPVQSLYQSGVKSELNPREDLASASSESDVSDDDDDDDDDDIGDVDFAEGINDIPKSKDNRSRKSKSEKVQAMTRAGVAYVSPEGQIFVLPEDTEDKHRSKNNSRNSSSEKKPKKNKNGLLPASKFLEKTNKRFPFASSLERQRKEKIGETTMLNGQGADLRRLKELEAQERLHRLQTAKMQEQITHLQRQQLERSHADLNSNNVGYGGSTINNSASLIGNQTMFHDEHKVRQYNGNVYMSGQQHQTNGRDDHALYRYSMPAYLSNPTLHEVRHSEPRLATTSDPANYTAHSAPLVGGDSSLGLSPGYNSHAIPSFTPQELAYLSEYMRVMGVTPPSTQQQWAVLLSTFNMGNNNNNNNHLTASGKNNMNNYNSPILQNNMATARLPETTIFYPSSAQTNQNYPLLGASFNGAGPNLSQVIGGTKTLDPTTSSLHGGHQHLDVRPTHLVTPPSDPHSTPLGSPKPTPDISGGYGVNKSYHAGDNNTAAADTNTTNGNMKEFPSQSDITTTGSHSSGESMSTDGHSGAGSLVSVDGSHLMTGQIGSTAGDGVRTTSVSGTAPATGVYGPLGLRQIST